MRDVPEEVHAALVRRAELAALDASYSDGATIAVAREPAFGAASTMPVGRRFWDALPSSTTSS